MKIAAVIPMKKLHLAKSRLSNILTPQQRKNLAMYLLDSTIKELKESKFISEIIIVSSDKAVKKYSCLKNLKFIKDSDEGVNNAVILADHYCINNDINANIVIPQDLPFISAKEIDEICTISINMINVSLYAHQNDLMVQMYCSENHQMLSRLFMMIIVTSTI